MAAVVPSGFVPIEDQGILLANMQLPNAASLARTSDAARRAEEVLAVARGIEEKEEAILADIRAGIDLAEARRRHGYHNLQTRQD